MNFLYITIFSLVPKKALFGRGQVASTLMALSISSILTSLLLWIDYMTIAEYFNLYVFGAIWILPFVCCRQYFLEIKRFRKNMRFYAPQKRWLLKLIGVFFLIITLISPMVSAIILTILKNN
jgi:hypothetical protein